MKRDNIIFKEDTHQYFYEGKELVGVTRIIGERLGKKFPKNIETVPLLEQATSDGKFIHAELEDFFRNGFYPENKASRWIADEIIRRYPLGEYQRFGEFLVSDFKTTATAIDIVILDKNRRAILIDIKTGAFDREYCSWQLGVNKRLIELEGDITVVDAFVASTKDQFFYRIIMKSQERIDNLFRFDFSDKAITA